MSKRIISSKNIYFDKAVTNQKLLTKKELKEKEKIMLMIPRRRREFRMARKDPLIAKLHESKLIKDWEAGDYKVKYIATVNPIYQIRCSDTSYFSSCFRPSGSYYDCAIRENTDPHSLIFGIVVEHPDNNMDFEFVARTRARLMFNKSGKPYIILSRLYFGAYFNYCELVRLMYKHIKATCKKLGMKCGLADIHDLGLIGVRSNLRTEYLTTKLSNARAFYVDCIYSNFRRHTVEDISRCYSYLYVREFQLLT